MDTINNMENQEIREKLESPSDIYVYSNTNYEDNYDIIFNNIGEELEIVLPDSFNEPLKENELQDNITSLVFGRFYNQKIEKNTLPPKLKYLVFGSDYNKILVQGVLPETLISLTFGKKYNVELDEQVLPNSLLYLKFGEKYNKQFRENTLPKSLTILEFDKYSCFNKKIKKNVLPQTLKKIIFGDNYNKKIKSGRLPSNLKYFIVGKNYSHFFENGELPTSLKYFEIGYYYVKNLINLPSSVEIVCFDKYIDCLLPSTVKKIIIKNYVKGIYNFSNEIKQIQILNYDCDLFNIVLPAGCELINRYGDKINI
jgi:hypothetical protein